MPEKVAVVLFNLGGPDGKETVRPFLYNFFSDPNIFSLPKPFRQILAVLISSKRSKCEAADSYKLLNWRSPLLANTRAQAQALEARLNAGGDAEFRCFVCMRYWYPMAKDVVEEVRVFNPDKIVLLPLYPQYSTTTTRSSFQAWAKAAKNTGLNCPVSAACCYPVDKGFVAASAERIKKAYAEALGMTGKSPRILFSAHGLPEMVIAGGDPYQWQCESTAKAIADATGIAPLDWQICYQSRVGRLKWIGPSTIEALEKAALDDVPVVIYPHAFVSEHVETLVEIDIEYRRLAEQLGIPYFTKVETVGTSESFIGGLKEIVLSKSRRQDISNGDNARSCPDRFGKCCMIEQPI